MPFVHRIPIPSGGRNAKIDFQRVGWARKAGSHGGRVAAHCSVDTAADRVLLHTLLPALFGVRDQFERLPGVRNLLIELQQNGLSVGQLPVPATPPYVLITLT